ncbi:hypothetical protein [Cesiribacter sp. SM1]|uniref:hypothetical protein n=1 Tax=Cesiribacter sp. SM1 TaxID=2861196 RepID=UPI001CD1E339|nr:hypothetical protein [Cesiribacter sp. SM1]
MSTILLLESSNTSIDPIDIIYIYIYKIYINSGNNFARRMENWAVCLENFPLKECDESQLYARQ